MKLINIAVRIRAALKLATEAARSAGQKAGRIGYGTWRWMMRSSLPVFESAYRCHKSWPRFWQHFSQSVVIGLLIEGVLQAAHGVGPVEDIQRWAKDWAIETLHSHLETGTLPCQLDPAGRRSLRNRKEPQVRTH